MNQAKFNAILELDIGTHLKKGTVDFYEIILVIDNFKQDLLTLLDYNVDNSLLDILQEDIIPSVSESSVLECYIALSFCVELIDMNPNLLLSNTTKYLDSILDEIEKNIEISLSDYSRPNELLSDSGSKEKQQKQEELKEIYGGKFDAYLGYLEECFHKKKPFDSIILVDYLSPKYKGQKVKNISEKHSFSYDGTNHSFIDFINFFESYAHSTNLYHSKNSVKILLKFINKSQTHSEKNIDTNSINTFSGEEASKLGFEVLLEGIENISLDDKKLLKNFVFGDLDLNFDDDDITDLSIRIINNQDAFDESTYNFNTNNYPLHYDRYEGIKELLLDYINNYEQSYYSLIVE